MSDYPNRKPGCRPNFIGYSLDRIAVHDREDHSHAHVSYDVIEKALQYIRSERRHFIIEDVTFSDGTHGFSDLVETDETDEIIYRKRKGRDGETRFVLGREGVRTNTLRVILLQKTPEQGSTYMLVTAYWTTGESEPEPWDKKAFLKDPRGVFQAKKASEVFWANHALVWKD